MKNTCCILALVLSPAMGEAFGKADSNHLPEFGRFNIFLNGYKDAGIFQLPRNVGPHKAIPSAAPKSSSPSRRSLSPSKPIFSHMLDDQFPAFMSMSLTPTLLPPSPSGNMPAPATTQPTKNEPGPSTVIPSSVGCSPNMEPPSCTTKPSTTGPIVQSATPTVAGTSPSSTRQPFTNTPSKASSPDAKTLPSMSQSPTPSPNIRNQSSQPQRSSQPSFHFTTPHSETPISQPGNTSQNTGQPISSSRSPQREPVSSPTFLPVTVVFICTFDGVAQAFPSFTNVTSVSFKVGYSIETNFSLDEYKAALERKILGSALAGALQCDMGGSLFGVNGTIPDVPIATIPTGQSCTPQNGSAKCTIFETAFQIVIEQVSDPSVASFLGYVTMQEEMDSGGFVTSIPILDRVVYLSPMPLLPPVQQPEGTNPPQIQINSSGLSVSPWTLGAVVAMCLGGVIALWVWARNRRTRNQRHMQLLEDSSFAASGVASA